MLQWNYPCKEDWTEELKNNLEELNINLTLDEIKMKSENSFKKLVKIKTREYALEYLLKIKMKHTKMDGLHYNELKMQKYFKDKNKSVAEATNLYRYRTRAAKYKNNMKNSYLSPCCPFCFVQLDSQQHSLQCEKVLSKIKIEGKYEDIFKEDIPSDITKTLMRMKKLREDVI